MFTHCNIHKHNWTSPDGKMKHQINHVLIDKRWHSSIVEVKSFRGTDSDTHYYLVDEEITERISVSKR
jgi:hypothetical protein